MRADDVGLVGFGAGKGAQIDKFGNRPRGDVEEAEYASAGGGGASVGPYFQEDFFFVGGVDGCGLANDAGAKDDGFPPCRRRGHLFDEIDVVLAGFVSEVDGAAGDTAGGGVEGRIRVGGLEHVPIRQDVQVASEEGVVGVGEDVPGVRGGNFGEEVVGVADHEAGLVCWELGVEDDLRGLGHAADGFYAEVTEGVDEPGVLIGVDEVTAVLGGGKEVEKELGVCFDAIDATGEEKAIKVVVEAVDVRGVDDGHLVAGDTFLFADYAGFVRLC